MTRTRGFTLIELLVAMGIGMVVLLLAVTSLDQAGTGYGRSTDGIAAEREARAVLTQIAEDLSKAVYHREMVMEENDDGLPRDRLGFLVLEPDDAQTDEQRIGDLCATVYYVKDLQSAGRVQRCLMRGFRGSEETFQALESGDVASLFAETAADEPVSFGVLSFDIQPLRRSPAGGWQEWPEASMKGADVPPEAVKIRLIVARRSLAGKLNSTEDWNSSPLIPSPDHVNESNQVESYEIIQDFAHAS
ncbi:prepilin-type N-terminal cleavage/methylation domain-containing protein [Haloferula sargassicola]|uniref:Prepilin-type N-terminal cleavage/methylation domain-containing protein n=1 Tax=Haloferula sargassicola TaxID=490096 RepID=A0ABP9UIL3_9BACT